MGSVAKPSVDWGASLRRGAATVDGFVRYVLRRFVADGGLTGAAALSYTTLLSLVPLIAIGLAVLSAFPIFANMRDQLLSDLFGKFIPEVGAEMEYWFRYFAGAAAKTTTLGVLALAITVVFMMGAIEDALDRIWHVRSSRPWLHRILAYWAILTMGPLLLGIAFSLPSYLDLVAERHGVNAGHYLAAPWAQHLLSFLLETLAFTLLYGVIPNCAVRRREAIVGGLVTAVLIDLLKAGFVLYVVHLSSYRAVYGALASIPIFLLWMYIVWAAVLFGAVVAAALPRWRLGLTDTPAESVERIGLGLALIAELLEQRRSGGSLTTEALARRLGVSASAAEDDLAALTRAGFVVRAAAGGWVLARALDSLTLLDFYRAMGLPLAHSLDSAETFPWHGRVAEALHRIAAVEASALKRPLSEVIQNTEVKDQTTDEKERALR